MNEKMRPEYAFWSVSSYSSPQANAPLSRRRHDPVGARLETTRGTDALAPAPLAAHVFKRRLALADLAHPTVRILDLAGLDARERGAQLLHHRARRLVTSREYHDLVAIVNLANRANDGRGAA